MEKAAGLNRKNLHLYHATDKSNLKSILKDGLLVNPTKHNWEDSEDGKIYLAFNPEVAEDYMWGMDEPPEEVVVLQIDFNKLDQDEFGMDWNNICEELEDVNSVVYCTNIPRSCISIYRGGEDDRSLESFIGTELYSNIVDCFNEYCRG